MCIHTNEHVLQLALCGGGCTYVMVRLCSVLCSVCVCMCMCVCAHARVCFLVFLCVVCSGEGPVESEMQCCTKPKQV